MKAQATTRLSSLPYPYNVKGDVYAACVCMNPSPIALSVVIRQALPQRRPLLCSIMHNPTTLKTMKSEGCL
ncbi:hypothetical protein ACFX1X_045588 [Malus domestica]